MKKRPIAAGKSSFTLLDHRALLASIPLREDGVLVDAGCGEGNYTIFLAPLVRSGIIYAIDLWEEGIRRLKERVRREYYGNVRPVVADLSKTLPLKDRSVDVCLMATVLHDLVQDRCHKKALQEIQRVLKPGGIFSVVEFKKVEGPPGPPRSIRLAPEDLMDTLASHGFTAQADAISLGDHLYMINFHHRP